MEGRAIDNNALLHCHVHVIRDLVVLIPFVTLELADIDVTFGLELVSVHGVQVRREDDVKIRAVGDVEVPHPQVTVVPGVAKVKGTLT